MQHGGRSGTARRGGDQITRLLAHTFAMAISKAVMLTSSARASVLRSRITAAPVRCRQHADLVDDGHDALEPGRLAFGLNNRRTTSAGFGRTLGGRKLRCGRW